MTCRISRFGHQVMQMQPLWLRNHNLLFNADVDTFCYISKLWNYTCVFKLIHLSNMTGSCKSLMDGKPGVGNECGIETPACRINPSLDRRADFVLSVNLPVLFFWNKPAGLRLAACCKQPCATMASSRSDYIYYFKFGAAASREPNFRSGGDG